MALSSQVPMPAKMKPLPPPKPNSQQNKKNLKQPLIDIQPGGGLSSGGRRTFHANFPPTGTVFALRGRPINEPDGTVEERSGDSLSPIKHSFKPKYLSDEVKSKKVLVSSETSPPVQETSQQTEGKSKPPLLPKPAVTRLSLQALKPPIPKRPSVNPLPKRNIQESGTQTNSAAKKLIVVNKVLGPEKSTVTKSSFSSLQLFESVVGRDGCENPVRPPRSPKNKPFVGMPFDFVGQQVVSSKQKNLSLPQSARQNAPIWAFWEHNSGATHQEEELNRQKSAREKARSLGRSISLFSHETITLRDDSELPTPPPRRLKKKSDFEANLLLPPKNVNTPVYAVVNYELKKNRRSQVVTDVEVKNLLSNHGSSNIKSAAASQFETDSKPGTEADWQLNYVDTSIQETDKILHSVIAQEDDKFKSENLDSCKSFVLESLRLYSDENRELKDSTTTSSVMEGTCDCDTSLDVCSHHVIKKDCDQPGKSEVDVMNITGSDLHNKCSKEDNDNKASGLESSSKKGSEVVIEGLCSEVIIEACGPLREDSDNANKICEDCESKKEIPILFDKEADNSLECQVSDKTDKLTKLDFTLNTTQGEGEITAESGHCTCEPLESNGQLKDFLSKTSCESCCSLSALENVKSGSGGDLEFKRNQSSSLPLRSKLNPAQCRDLESCRRLSWCDGQKKESSTSSTTSGVKQRKKKKIQSLWCDEGDLSSGHLGDQSSFEDVPMAETGDVSPVCRRLSAIFSSFGKSSRKPRKQAEKAGKIVSRFYCSSHDENVDGKQGESVGENKSLRLDSEALNFSSSSRLENESGEGSDKSLVIEGKEEISTLCVKVNSLDLKRKSDEFGSEHLSEGSYENEESEIEDTTQPEDKLDTSLTAAQRREKKAFYIAQELMTSEGVFVDVLRLLCIDFRKAVLKARAEENNEIIPEVDLGKILNNLPHLLSFNEDLLHDLENRISNWNSNPKIADIIVRKGPFLKLYTSYFQNFETQCQFLDEYCESNSRFAKVVRDFEASPRCQKLAVKHYMLKPIQRVPQYRLLLEDYLAHLDPTSDDYNDTQVALSIVRDVADHANRSMKQGDTFSKLLHLQSLLKNYVIIKPGRTFLKEGELQKLCRKGMQSRYFILLNDCLLYATYDIPGSLKVNYELPLSGMRVEIPVAEDYTNEFSIISVTRSFTLSASSAPERCEWVSTLRKAIQDHTSRQLSFLQVLAQDGSKQMGSEPFQLGTAAPVWIQDCRVTMCQLCTAEFTVTFRRHHCRACGKVVCGICSANKAPLQYMKFQTARVCDECYESLLKDFDENQKSIQEAIQHEICSPDFADTAHAFKTIKASFKKLIPTTGRKAKRFIPQRLKEVCANDTGSQMSGWLHWRHHKSWKKNWFVLKEQVLYVYKASEDVVALKSIPILGCEVSTLTKSESLKDEADEGGIGFILTHKGRIYLEFQTDNVHSSKRWICAMQEATVLK